LKSVPKVQKKQNIKRTLTYQAQHTIIGFQQTSMYLSTNVNASGLWYMGDPK